MRSALISRNITVNGRRTSIRLDPVTWQALADLCAAEDVSIHAFCARIDAQRRGVPLTTAVRAAVLDYYRRPAGHAPAPRRPSRSAQDPGEDSGQSRRAIGPPLANA